MEVVTASKEGKSNSGKQGYNYFSVYHQLHALTKKSQLSFVFQGKVIVSDDYFA